MSPPRSITDVTDAWPGWTAVLETLSFRAGHNTAMVMLAATLLGLAAGVVGVFAMLRRRSLMSDALSHATLPGIAAAFLLTAAIGGESRAMPVLLAGAAVTAILGVLCVHGLLRHTRLHEDAAIGIVLSVFFGAGVVLLSWIQQVAPAGAAGLEGFIHGQTAAMGSGDAQLMAAIAVAAVCGTGLLLKEFALTCFDEAFAAAGVWPTGRIDLVLMALLVTVTVAGLQAVGLLLVVAMLIIPPAAARFWTDRLWTLVLAAGLIGAACGYFGSATSSLLPRKPAGAVIVLVAGGVFAASLLLAPRRGVLAQTLRRLGLRLRIAGDHVLEAAHDRGDGRLPAAALGHLAAVRGWSRGFTAIVLRSLHRTGRLKRGDGDIVLTEAGRRDGARVSRNHRLWEAYLVTHADIAPSHVDWSVDQVEHVLPEAVVAELERTLAAADAAGARAPA